MNEGIFIAVLVGLVEIYLLLKLIGNYKDGLQNIPSGKEITGELDKILFQNKPDETGNMLLIELSSLIGTQYTLSELHLSVKRYLTGENETLRLKANLGPAIGLLATFCGMFFLVLKIAGGAAGINEGILNAAFQNLFPVFVGGALGIVVYAVGISLLNKLECIQQNAENEIISAFILFEEEKSIARPANVEEAYAKLLKPLTDLTIRLMAINENFKEFSTGANGLISEYSNKTNEFIEKINNSASSITARMNANAESTSKVAENILGWNKTLDDFYEKWKESSATLTEFSTSIGNYNDRLLKVNELIGAIPNLLGKMDSNSGKMDLLLDSVDVDKLDVKKMSNNVAEFTKMVAEFVSALDKMNLSGIKLENNLKTNFTEISKNTLDRFEQMLEKYKKDLLRSREVKKRDFSKIENQDKRESRPPILKNEKEILVKNNGVDPDIEKTQKQEWSLTRWFDGIKSKIQKWNKF